MKGVAPSYKYFYRLDKKKACYSNLTFPVFQDLFLKNWGKKSNLSVKSEALRKEQPLSYT